jgi:hypothetical protein
MVYIGRKVEVWEAQASRWRFEVLHSNKAIIQIILHTLAHHFTSLDQVVTIL